jgi:hypothetical protein
MVEVLQANGAPLPGWLRFDPTSGTFHGTPPDGWRQPLVLRVVARDNQGHQAATSIRLQFDAKRSNDQHAPSKDNGHRPDIQGRAHTSAVDRFAWVHERNTSVDGSGKAALNEQFAHHGKPAWLREQDALIAHAETLARMRPPS